MRFCAEPPPDVALQRSMELLAKADLPQANVTASGSAKLSADVIALAGRTQSLLFLREALYRLCEQSINGNLSRAEVGQLIAKVLKAGQQIAEAQLVKEIRETPADKLPAVTKALTAPVADMPPPELPPPIAGGGSPP